MLIMTVVGARPQFVKAAVVSRILRTTSGVTERLIHTGQHYDTALSDVFFQELALPEPDYNLGIGSGPHGQQTGLMLAAIEQVLLQDRPDWVLLYGDTNSTVAGALAAAKLHIPIAHVEAGLRSFDRRHPEEINRITTDHLSNVLFPPTLTAVNHLKHEGFSDECIHRVGDVMYDAALHYSALADARSHILDTLGLTDVPYLLATIHRPENTDDPEHLRNICAGLCQVAADVVVVLPLHPRTRAALQREALLETLEQHCRITLPVGYLDMVMLEKHARVIVTDSGGVQKEAFFHQIPCITLKPCTEWVELVELGWNHLVAPTSTKVMVDTLYQVLQAPSGTRAFPYGDGHASEKIVEVLCQEAWQA